METESTERICFNCTFFFPSTLDEMTEYGICLDDPEFEPFIDEFFDRQNLDCCRDLIERKKFPGENDACEKFEESESIPIDEGSPLGEDLRRLTESGELTESKLKEILHRHWIEDIDIRNAPVDDHVEGLKSTSWRIKTCAVRNLGGLIAQENRKAFDALFGYLKQLPPAKTTEEVHFRREILHALWWRECRKNLIPVLVDELYRTESNNTTRQWFTEIFRFLERCDPEDVEEPLERMLQDKRFSYRLKKRMRSILKDEDFW